MAIVAVVGMEMFIEGGPGSDGVTEWSEKGGLCWLEKSGNEKVRWLVGGWP